MKQNKVMASYRVEAITKERIKEIAEQLQITEAGVVDNLIEWYYKSKVRLSTSKKGKQVIETKEFLPF